MNYHNKYFKFGASPSWTEKKNDKVGIIKNKSLFDLIYKLNFMFRINYIK